MKPRLKLVKGFSVLPQTPPPGTELDTAIARFLVARQAVGAGTLKQYRRVMDLYKQLNPDWPPTMEGAANFVEYCQGHYEKSTISNYYGVIRNFIRFSLNDGLITTNPLHNFTPPRKPQTLPRAPQAGPLKKLIGQLEKEVEETLRGVKSRRRPWLPARDLALVSIMVDTGLRVFEVVNLRLEDINLEAWTVFVREGKETKQRELPLGRLVRGDLNLWFRYRDSLPIKATDKGRDFLFVSHRRGFVPMDPSNVRLALKRACQRAGIDKITPHLLRHFFAGTSHEKGASTEQVRKWMGHTNLETTARYLLMNRQEFEEHLRSSPRDHL